MRSQRRTFFQRVERTTQLIGIAVRHGYGSLLVRVGWSVPADARISVDEATAEQFRDALAEAGVTFIKLGQKLSTRPDLLPVEYIEALATLQEDVPSPPVEELQAVLTEELGRPLESVFAEFLPQPVAAASIGVVFRARLAPPDGRWVAVKIQRPGVAEQVATDLHILADLVSGLERHISALRRYEPVELVREFRETLKAELDYLEEAARTHRLHRALEHHDGVSVPGVVAHLSTSRVLVTEWVDGARVSDTETLRSWQIDGTVIARRLAQSLLRQALEEGCFHGDPHAGNIRITRDGRAYFLDFGGVTYLGRAGREQMQRLLGALFLQRADLVVTTLVNAGVLGPGVEVTRFQRDLDRLIARHFGSDNKTRLGPLITDFLRLICTYETLRLPSEWVALFTSICMLDGVCHTLDPSFSFVDAGRQVTQSGLGIEVEWRRWFREHLLTAQGLSELLAGLPGRAERLLTRLESGDLKIRHAHANPEDFWRPLGHIVNRLTGGIVVSALVLGSALMASRASSGWTQYGWQLLMVLSAIGGAALLWSVLRSGRH